MKSRLQQLAFFGMLIMLPISFVQGQISGQILDTQHQPVFGAHVIIKPSNRVYRTGEMGHFSINQLSVNDTLIASHIAHVSDTFFVSSLQDQVTIELEDKVVSFEGIVVTPAYDPDFQLVQVALQTQALNSSQELLKLVPGLFIGQHAGGGKAEQLFLRGFDLDHGTDLAIAVDGMPVNMVSHAHGQGYSDLHFLIPESVQQLTFKKGPHSIEKGNFNVAGHVNFQTKSRMENEVKLEWGQFGSRRLFGSVNLLNNTRHKSFLTAETYFTEGPFESPQGLRKYNLLFKEQWKLGSDQWLGFRAMGFHNSWTASGQIPDRLVKNGTISRFGAVDDTEGGTTWRTSISSDFKTRLWGGTFYSQLDWIQYDFELYSNFTFFLNDPINGDQIRQAEHRNIWNALTRFESDFNLGKVNAAWQLGLGYRGDGISGSELTQTRNRKEVILRNQLGDIEEDNVHAFASLNALWGKWSITTGARYDQFYFSYDDQLLSNTGKESKGFFSPKLTVSRSLSDNLQATLKLARGFHSNDSRGATQTDTLNTLPAAYGVDLNVNWQPGENFYLSFTGYHLALEQELVYVGDEGIVEPSESSTRKGFEAGLRVEPSAGLFIHTDINFADARFNLLEDNHNFVPLAPRWSGTFGVDYHHTSGLQLGLNYMGMTDRPANEDRSIIALGYGITSIKCQYVLREVKFGFEIQNLFNVDWNEAQFATRSRLRDEPLSVEELHYTPGTPFFLKSSLAYRF